MKLKENSKRININNNILDVITPMGIEFNKVDFQFGENMARVLCVINYPPRVNVGWMSRIANMRGVICSMHITPTDPSKLIERLSSSITELAAKINAGGSALSIQRNEQQHEDAKILLKKMDQNQENVFNLAITIMVLGNDKDELYNRSKKVESALIGASMRARPAVALQDEGLLTVSPFMLCDEKIQKIANRNMPVSTVAGMYPFAVSGINDEKGYIFGTDNSGEIAKIDPWLRGGDRTNSNWSILGLPGVGKSATVKKMLLNEYAQGTKCIIIDPEREYKEMCESLNGQWINCGGGDGGRINPLQIKNVPKDDEDEENILYKDEGKGMSALSLHFQTLRTFFSLYLKDLTSLDKATLEESLEEIYKEKGITWDTDPRTLSNKDYPILSELYELLIRWSEDENNSMKKRERCETIAALLRSSSIGADSSLWNGHTTLEQEKDFIVLDTYNLQNADDTIKRTQYFNILTWAWQTIAENRNEKVIIAVDESYLLVDPEVPQALHFLRNVSKRIRKYLGGLWVISHSAVDFLDESVKRYGQALLDNPCFKFFMGTDGKNLKELSDLMDLTEAEQELLAKKQRGHGLLIAGSKRIHARVELTTFELEIFGKGGGK